MLCKLTFQITGEYTNKVYLVWDPRRITIALCNLTIHISCIISDHTYKTDIINVCRGKWLFSRKWAWRQQVAYLFMHISKYRNNFPCQKIICYLPAGQSVLRKTVLLVLSTALGRFFAHTKQHSKLQPAHFTAIFLSLAYTKYNEKHSSKPVCFLFYNFISQVNLISAIR